MRGTSCIPLRSTGFSVQLKVAVKGGAETLTRTPPLCRFNTVRERFLPVARSTEDVLLAPMQNISVVARAFPEDEGRPSLCTVAAC